MDETYAERRLRILLMNPGANASDYDTCVLFGYGPESWDGMWKLHARVPIIQISRNWAIALEYRTPQSRYWWPRLVRAVDARRA